MVAPRRGRHPAASTAPRPNWTPGRSGSSGVTLVVLGLLVIGNLARKGHSHRALESRIAFANLCHSVVPLESGVSFFSVPKHHVRSLSAGRIPSGFCFRHRRAAWLWVQRRRASSCSFCSPPVSAEPPAAFLGLAAFALGLIAMNAAMTATLGRRLRRQRPPTCGLPLGGGWWCSL